MSLQVNRPRSLVSLPPALPGYAAGVAGVAATTGVIAATLSVLRVANVSILYLLVVLAVAIRFGFRPAAATALLAVVTYDLFFVWPEHVSLAGNPEEWLSLLHFLVVAFVASRLTGLERRQAAVADANAARAEQRAREARALSNIGHILNTHQSLDRALQEVLTHLQAELHLTGCAILVPDGASSGRAPVPRVVAGDLPPLQREWLIPTTAPDVPDLAGAPGIDANGSPAGTQEGDGERRWVRVHQPARAEVRAARHRLCFEPLIAVVEQEDRRAGTLCLVRAAQTPAWTPEEQRLIDTAAMQIALAIESARLRRQAVEAEVLRRTQEVQQALLDSVSHNLRTPLASIKTSASSLRQPDVQWSDAERHTFLGAIEQEADHLTRLVENLLDMSRIQAGALRPRKDFYPLFALVDDVLGRLRAQTAGHVVQVDVPPDLPPVLLDYVQIGEVLFNLIENAVQYTPPGSTIRIGATRQGEQAGSGETVTVTIADDGSGISPDALPRIFDKFYRVASGDTARTKGTGLGLAVARGLVEAHGGRVEALSPPPGQPHGTLLRVILPLDTPAGTPAGPTISLQEASHQEAAT